MSRIIALTGPAGCGKSTIAVALYRHYGFDRVRFAGPLKAMLTAFYENQGLDQHEAYRRVEGDLKEFPDPYLNGATPRHAMQTLGTEWGRDLVSSDLWVAAWRRAATAALAGGAPGVVADDCRFPNECATVRAMGGVIVQLDRLGVSRRMAHVSEVAQLPDAYVPNDDEPAQVAARILALCPAL